MTPAPAKRLLLAATLVAALLPTAALAPPAGAAGGPAGPSIDAPAYTIVDAKTGEVLAANAAHAHRAIASITKLMTVLVVLEQKRPGDIVDVDPRATAVGESSVELRPHERLSVSDLLKATLIQSANDAADALALSVAPSFTAFAALMNEKARELGLRDSHFVRPDGLDAPGEYSSAADVTTLARRVMRNRLVRRIVALTTTTIAGGRTLHTWDDLLGRVPGLLGGKTGHTDSAGWCEVAAVRGRGVTVYATVLGGSTRSVRNAELSSLLAWGLTQFRNVDAIDATRAYASVELPYGRAPLELVATRPLQLVARVGRPLTERIVAPTAVTLPVTDGERLGTVEILRDGRLVGSRPLVASRSVARPGVPGRLRWYTTRTLHHLRNIFP